MMVIDMNSLTRICLADQSGRAVCPQTAVRLEWTALYSEGEPHRRAEANGALGTERPTIETAVRLECHTGKACGMNGAPGTECPIRRDAGFSDFLIKPRNREGLNA